MKISQPATTAKTAHQILIAVNLAQDTCHMMKYQRFLVKAPEPGNRFDGPLGFELETAHYRHDG